MFDGVTKYHSNLLLLTRPFLTIEISISESVFSTPFISHTTEDGSSVPAYLQVIINVPSPDTEKFGNASRAEDVIYLLSAMAN